MGPQKLGDTYYVRGEDIRATGAPSYDAGEHKGSQQEEERQIEEGQRTCRNRRKGDYQFHREG